jgi:Domain of unknown function (DUF4082)
MDVPLRRELPMKKLISIFLALAFLVLPTEAQRRFVPKPAAANSTTWVTGQTLGYTLNATRQFGVYFTVGTSAVTVTHLGRWKMAGNSQTHNLRLITVSGTILGSVDVDLSTGTSDTYVFAELSSPVVLSASTDYALLSVETSGGDDLTGHTNTLTTTGVITAFYTTFRYNDGDSVGAGDADNMHGPVNFKYSSP